MSFDRQFVLFVFGLVLVVIGSEAAAAAEGTTTKPVDKNTTEITICDGAEKVLECSDEQLIAIKSAGFTTSNECPVAANQTDKSTECVSSTLGEFYQQQCDKRSNCTIKVDKSKAPISDECKTKNNALILSYNCKSSASTVTFKYVASIIAFAFFFTLLIFFFKY